MHSDHEVNMKGVELLFWSTAACGNKH